MKINQFITPIERICVTLRYLITDGALVTTYANYRMSAVVITQIVQETCNAIWKILVENSYLEELTTEDG